MRELNAIEIDGVNGGIAAAIVVGIAALAVAAFGAGVALGAADEPSGCNCGC